MNASATPTAVLMPSQASAVLAPFHAERTRLFVLQWLAHLEDQVRLGQVAAETIHTYRRNIRRWEDYLESIGRTDQPTPAVVSAYVAALIPGHKPASVNALLFAVRSFYRWCESTDRFPNIARATRSCRIVKDSPLPALDHGQVGKLLALITGDDLAAKRDRALVRVMYATACRCVSLARADVSDVNLEAGTLAHQPKGHASKDARAYMAPGAVAALRDYIKARGPIDPAAPLFANVKNLHGTGARLTTASMRRIVSRLMLKAGHSRRDEAGRLTEPGVYSAHSLRRSAVTTAYEAAGLDAAQTLAGHASSDTTRKAYAKVARDRQLRSLMVALDI